MAVDVFMVHPDELARPNAGGVKSLQNGPVPEFDAKVSGLFPLRRFHEPLGIVSAQHGGEALFPAWSRNEPCRVRGEDAFPVQIFEEGPQRGQLPGDRGFPDVKLHEMRHELTKELMVDCTKLRGAEEIEELVQVREVAPFRVRGDVLFMFEVPEKVEDVPAHEITLA